jgi:hypothetical protein
MYGSAKSLDFIAHEFNGVASDRGPLDFDRHTVSDHFLFDRAPDRLNPNDLTLNVIDIGVVGNGCENRLAIKGIGGTGVFTDDARELLRREFLFYDEAESPDASP